MVPPSCLQALVLHTTPLFPATVQSPGHLLPGMPQVREVYESAIEAQPPQALSDADTRTLCLRYAALERRLGEVDRARAIYVHASSLADPRGDRGFWEEWNSFEVKHGNEDTFRWGRGGTSAAARVCCRACDRLAPLGTCRRAWCWSRGLCQIVRRACIVPSQDPGCHVLSCWQSPSCPLCREMLRIKRSVAAAFSQQHFNTTIIDAAAVASGTAAPPAAADASAKRKREGGDDMAALEAAATGGAAAPADALQPGTRVRGFVSAGIIQQGNEASEAGNGNGTGAPAAPANPEELDLGEEEGDGEEGGAALEVEQQAVPEAVFGSLAAKRQKTDA